jgi:hypothetical protein
MTLDPKRNPISPWISGVIIIAAIVILSLAAAVICFNVLQSSAEATLQNWKVGGGIAAFLVTASFLSSTFLSLYRLLTTDQIEDYRERIQELEKKLIKGAPCPPKYTIDVDEKHKLVFARPDEWEPKGGILYAYVEKKKENDTFFANFVVTYANEKEFKDLPGGFDSSVASIDRLYQAKLEGIRQGLIASELTRETAIVEEFTLVDGERSIRYTNSYTIEVPTPDEAITIKVRQSGVLTYVPRLRGLFEFAFTDNEEDFLVSSEVFNNVIASIRFL